MHQDQEISPLNYCLQRYNEHIRLPPGRLLVKEFDQKQNYADEPLPTSELPLRHTPPNNIDDLLEQLHIESTKITTLSGFKTWVRRSLRAVLPHEALCCGFGRLNSGYPSVDGVISVDYPIDFLACIQNSAGGIDSPLLKRWLVRQAPFTFSGTVPWPGMPADWLEQFRKHDLRNAAVHGVADERISMGTYYSFHRIPESSLPMYESLLRKITPIMHLALSPLISSDDETHSTSKILKTLTKRELEIVEWVKMGKTNYEIGQILGLAEMTVKHHLCSIFQKFGDIGSRVQLATKLTRHDSQKSLSNKRLQIL